MFKNLNQKLYHVFIIIGIIFVILCIAGILVIRYQFEGETNMPFKITKISLIQSVEGIENQNTGEKWNFNVNQNNDVYVGLPSVINANGISSKVFIELNEEETNKLQSSIDIIKEAIESLDE